MSASLGHFTGSTVGPTLWRWLCGFSWTSGCPSFLCGYQLSLLAARWSVCTSAQVLIHLHIQQVCTEHLLLLFDSFTTPWTIARQTSVHGISQAPISYSSRAALCWHFRLNLFQGESPLCSQTALSQAGGHCCIGVGGDTPRWQCDSKFWHF